MYFLPRAFTTEVENIETEEFYPSVKINLSYNSSEFEALAQELK